MLKNVKIASALFIVALAAVGVGLVVRARVSRRAPRTIIDQVQALMQERRFDEALPLIEELVRRVPDMATSQFNLGVCLDGLGRHLDASRAFMRAYALVPTDGGALYRACATLAKGREHGELLRIAQIECELDPEMLDLFLQGAEFEQFCKLPGFADLRKKHGR